MKPFVKNILITGILAIVGSTSIVAQTSNGWFEQWYRAKYGRPSPTEQARLTAGRTATGTMQATVAVSTNGRFEQWYRAKYGRPSPTEEARIEALQVNMTIPEATAPAIAVSAGGAVASLVPPSVMERLSRPELDTLIASAKTPAEHRRIAEFYQSQAQSYLAQAREHEAMVAAYKANPGLDAKVQSATVNHCEYFATKFRELAGKSQQTAQLHEQMARGAAQR
jgi:hypothetical protein